MSSAAKQLRSLSVAAFIVASGMGVLLVTDSASMASPETGRRTIAVSERHIVALEKKSKPQVAVDLRRAIEQRKLLLTRSLKVNFTAPNKAAPVSSVTLSLSEKPSWIVFEARSGEGVAAVSEERVYQHLLSYPAQGIPKARTCTVLSTYADDKGVLRAQTDCTAQSGYFYDTALVAGTVAKALENGETEISYPLTEIPASVVYPDISADPLKLLSTGHSTFQGSGLGRKSNVRKVLNERLHNVVIPDGAVFSYNDTLGTVTIKNGWQMALVIFEGGDLRPAPGGGICQGSTTVYRAALAAGLPIVQQKNHSLYVTYYEQYGVGQDATVFPGRQDFKFKNDTGGPIVMQAYNQGDEAFVQFYGFDDGRSVSISGPYFTSTAPGGMLDGKKIRGNEIGWLRTVALPGSETVRETFVARYKAIPKSLPKKWAATTAQVRSPLTAGLVAER